MSFSRVALLTSLTCFTLGVSSLQGSNLCVTAAGDDDRGPCITAGTCTEDSISACSSKYSLRYAIGDWVDNPGVYENVTFVVPDTYTISEDSPTVTAGSLVVNSTYPGGTILSSDASNYLFAVSGDGASIEIGPEGSELISMKAAPSFNPDAPTDDPARFRAEDRGVIILGPRFVYPLSNLDLYEDTPDCFRFELSSYGGYRFTYTGTTGVNFKIDDGQPGYVWIDPDVVITGNKNFYIYADEGSRLLLRGSGLSSQLISLQTEHTAFRFDHVNIYDATFGMSVTPFGSGIIGMYSGALQFVTSFDLEDDHTIAFYETGTLEVPSSVTATILGAIEEGGLFIKTGGGTLELRGTSTHTGQISIEDGIFSIDRADRIGLGQINITSPGVLQLTDSLTLSNTLSTAGGSITILNGAQGSFSGTLSGSSSFSISDGSTDETAIFSYSGNGTEFSGGLTFSNVEFLIGSSNATSADMDITLSNGASLTLNNHDISIKSLVGTDSAVNLGSGTLSIYQVSSTATVDAIISGVGGSVSFFSANSNSVTTVLEGANTYTGTTTIGSYVSVEIEDAENLGAGTSIRVEDEGKLTIAGFTNEVVLAQGFEFISGTGRITLDTNSTTLEIDGQITGSGSLYLSGEGSGSTLTLESVADSYSGDVTIDDATLVIRSGVTPSLVFKEGTLQVESDTTLDDGSTIFLDSGGGDFSVDEDKKLSISGVISGTNGVTFSGEGVTLLSGINTYEGDTKLTKGTVQISSDDNLGAVGEDQDLVFAGDGVIPILQILSSMDSERQLKIQGNGGGIEVDSGAIASFTGAVNIRSGPPIFTKSGGGDLSMLPGTPSTLPQLTVSVEEGSFTSNMNLLENSSIAISAGATFTISESDVGFYYGANSGLTITGEGSFIKDGEGTLNFLVPLDTSHSQLINTYSGGTNLKSGTLVISVDRALGDPTGTLTMNGGTLKTVVVPGSSSNIINSTRPIVLNVDSTFDTACTTANPCSTGSPCCSLLALSGEVSGSGGITKTSNGTLSLLNTANSFSGSVRVEGGTLRVIDPGSLGESSSLTLSGGTLKIGGSNTYSKAVSIESAGGAFFIESGISATLSGVISGEGAVTYLGLGTAVPTGSNTYKGGTTFINGTVQISSDANLGDSSSFLLFKGDGGTPKLQALADIASTRTIGIQSGAEIIVDSGFTASFTGPVAVGMNSPYPLIKSGGGDLSILPVTPSLIPQIAVDIRSGNMMGNMNFLRSSSIQIASGSVLTLEIDEDSLYSGTEAGNTISGDGSLVIKGGEELAFLVPLPGAAQIYNSYTGGTTLEEGVLTISADYLSSSRGVLGSSTSTLIGAGGTLKTVVLSGQETNLVTSNREISLTADTTFNTTCRSIGSCSTLVLNGDITGDGGLIKEGSGVLVLTGENTYTGDTTVNDGVLVITGSSTSYSLVALGGFLKGNGEISSAVIFGGLAGGASIGTLTVDGDLTYEPGSTFYIEITKEAASLVDVSGSVTVAGDTTVLTVPFPAEYDGPVTHVVLASPSITGTFTNVTAPPAFFMVAEATYTGTEVLITITPERIAPQNAGLNADAVASSLNSVIQWNRENVTLNIPNIYEGSNIKLTALFESLLPINDDSSELASALDQMHPAALKGVVVAQENATVQVQESLSTRLNEEMETLDCARTRQAYTFWINGMGAATNQDSNTYKGSPQAGYNNTMAGFVAGADYRFKDLVYVGVLGGYTSSYLSFEKNRGSGNVHTGYFGLYTSVIGEGYFANASVTGGWNGYSANRHIEYTGVNVTAKNSHGGRQLMSHIEGGLNLPAGKFNIRPFDRFDYLTQKEYGYKEKDAGDWNLSVNKNTSILLRNELGLQFASCFQVKTGKFTVSPKVSWIREIRTRGSTYTAAFTDAEDFSFTVKGYFPNRSLFSTGGVITGSLLDDTLSLSAYYDGEFTGGYTAHRYGGEVRYSF